MRSSDSSSPSWLNVLGPEFIEAFVAMRRDELKSYRTWLDSTITDWELERHLQHH